MLRSYPQGAVSEVWMAAGVVTALLQKSSKCSGVLVLPGAPAVLDKTPRGSWGTSGPELPSFSGGTAQDC